MHTGKTYQDVIRVLAPFFLRAGDVILVGLAIIVDMGIDSLDVHILLKTVTWHQDSALHLVLPVTL